MATAGTIPGIEDAREILKKHKIVIAGIGETDQGKSLIKAPFSFSLKLLKSQLKMLE